MDFQRAVQAYLWPVPYVSFQAFHEEIQRHGGGQVSALPTFENRLQPNTCVYTVNGIAIVLLDKLLGQRLNVVLKYFRGKRRRG